MTGTRRRVAAVALTWWLAGSGGLLPLTGLTPSYGDPSPTPGASSNAGPGPGPGQTNDDSPAEIQVTKIAPRAPMDPAEFFQVRGTVTNRGSQTLHELTVRLRRGEKLSSRSELATADADPPATETRVGRTPVRAAVQDLAPGRTTTFDIRIRVSQLRFGDPRAGVYPLRVEARGQFGGTGRTESLGGVLTYVPWFPDGPPPGKVRIAWLWPLVDLPRRGPREVMLDDELATSFAVGGRLDRMIRSAEDGAKGGRCDAVADTPETLPPRPRVTPCRAESVPVTYGVDPDLLYTANALTSPYLLQVGAKTKRIEDTGPATRWLTEVRAAVGAGDVLSLPYGDPDVVALTAPETGLADEIPLLRGVGSRETEKVLHRQPMTALVWPPAGRLTRRAVEALTSGGATAVAVDPAALPVPQQEPNRTPDTDVGDLPTSTGQTSVLTIDPVLSGLLVTGGDPATYPGDRLVEQRWLAETAMISAEAPSVSRTILVAPPRLADLHTAVAADAVRDSGRLPWLCPVSLTSVTNGADACNGEVRAPSATRPPVELAAPQAGDPKLDADTLARVRELRRISTQFTDEVLDQPTSPEAVGTIGRLTRARARAESSAWRGRPGGDDRLTRLLSDDIEDLRGKVHLQVGGGVVTLTSSSGVISVNAVNELDQPVRVGVALDAFNRARLSTLETPITTVAPHHATQINLKVTAQTSGQFPVRAQLVDRQGRPYGTQNTLIVRSTQYGRVALAVTGIGAGVLLVAAGVRIFRRALRRGRA